MTRLKELLEIKEIMENPIKIHFKKEHPCEDFNTFN